ncbi:hypothetical protein, partial [uncultured Bacteroides sp.]|uniref:hypothetical protein n=1 Tax=uncultured Bacteroides sp. TaxID=162156 RepID=UPI00266FB887
MISKFKLYITSVALALCCVSCLDKLPEDAIPFDKAIRTVKDVDLQRGCKPDWKAWHRLHR